MPKKPTRRRKEYPHKKLGAKLKAARIKLGYTSAEAFAYEHDLSRTQYGDYESGANVQFGTLLKILKALGTTPSEFFKDYK